MSAQTDHLSEINKKHRQKMLMLMKSKAENMFNRPSPLSSIPVKPSPPISSIGQTKQASTLQFLKQYQSNKTSQPDHDVSSIDRADKSMDYNSTLFRYFKQQSNVEKPSQFMNNGSSVSSHSGVTQNLESNQLLKDNNLLSKIDQLLNARKKTGTQSSIKGVYDDYLSKKSMTNSSVFSNNNSSNFHQFSQTQSKLKPNTGTLVNKLKTIQEQQKATLTIDRQQADKKLKKAAKEQQKQQKSTIKKPPLAPVLQSSSAMERQKKKIQQTMQQIKREQSQFIEKDSLILQFSDNESEQSFLHEQKPDANKHQKQSKRMELIHEKEELERELAEVEAELRKLQQQEQEDEQYC